jgi:hypothetical protein
VNGEIYEVKIIDQFDKFRTVSRIIQPITFADRVKDLILGCNAAQYKIYDD